MKKRINKYHLVALFLCCISGVVNCFAEGISVENASGRFKDSFYHVDANITYELSENVQEALAHGITLRFDITIVIKRERRWMWDKKFATTTLIYQLEYLPLSNSYLVTNIITGERNLLFMLEEALTFLGSVESFPVISEAQLDPERNYRCLIMSDLRIRTLPIPLQPLALVSPSWNLSSNWYEWNIR